MPWKSYAHKEAAKLAIKEASARSELGRFMNIRPKGSPVVRTSDEARKAFRSRELPWTHPFVPNCAMGHIRRSGADEGLTVTEVNRIWTTNDSVSRDEHRVEAVLKVIDRIPVR